MKNEEKPQNLDGNGRYKDFTAGPPNKSQEDNLRTVDSKDGNIFNPPGFFTWLVEIEHDPKKKVKTREEIDSLLSEEVQERLQREGRLHWITPNKGELL